MLAPRESMQAASNGWKSERPCPRPNPSQPARARSTPLRLQRSRLSLLWLLKSNRQPVYSIEGLGASGKTALALGLAWEIVGNPGSYPYRVVAWLAARNPALVPIGPGGHPRAANPCRTRSRAFAAPSAICWTIQSCSAPLNTAARRSSSRRSLRFCVSSPMLLVLDEVEQIVPHEAALLLELLHAIPCPSSALVTARGYHEIGFPTRVTWLTDDEMDNFIARACDDTRARLTRAQQRLVRAWAHGLPFAARVAMCRIQHVDVIRALEDFSRGPAPLVRPVIGQALSSLRREHADSYCGLQRLAEQDIERGMARLDALNLLDPEDPDAAMKELLQPLLKANLVVSKQMNNHQRDTISPLVLWYLRRAAAPHFEEVAMTTYFVPQRSFQRLIGREAKVREIMARLSSPRSRSARSSPSRAIGGLGKTALAQEIAWRYVEEREYLPPEARFDVIIWAAARPQSSSNDARGESPAFTALDDVFRAVAAALKIPTLMQVSPHERPKQCWAALHMYRRVLLVVDNLEEDADDSISGFLRDLPDGVKALVTTRFHENLPRPFRLGPLQFPAARELVVAECSSRGAHACAERSRHARTSESRHAARSATGRWTVRHQRH